MSEQSVVFFPLRSNARSLVAGAPVNAVRRRLKVASLLNDEVWIEAGSRQIAAGPRGSMSWTIPMNGGMQHRFQTPVERGRASGDDFHVAVKDSRASDDEPFRQLMRSPASIYWRPTFEPIRSELPASATWIHFGLVSDAPGSKAISNRWQKQDSKDAWLARREPEPFVRNQIIQNANLDFLLSAGLGVAIAMDPFHAQVASSRVVRGHAKPLLEYDALAILVPDVGSLTWEDITELRQHRSFRDYRRVIREIGREARRKSLEQFPPTEALRREYEVTLLSACDNLRSSFSDRVLTGGLSIMVGIAGEAIGQASTGMPIIGSVAGSAASTAIGMTIEARREPKWVSFDQELKRRIAGPRLSPN